MMGSIVTFNARMLLLVLRVRELRMPARAKQTNLVKMVALLG